MFLIGTEERAVVTEVAGTVEARAVDTEVAREAMGEVAAMAATERKPKKRKIL